MPFLSSATQDVKVRLSREPRELPADDNDIGFQPGIPSPIHYKNIIMYLHL